MENEYRHSFGKLLRDEDLQEDDVWAPMKVAEGSSSTTHSSSSKGKDSSSRRIPRTNSGGSLEANITNHHHQEQPSSAPVNIPDWSKIYKKKNSEVDGVDCSYHESVEHVLVNQDVDYEEGEEEMVPPHEYIARKFARSQIASFSMCEGIGRTLKGRDLSKLRNAILTKTGFLE